jgi:hypothetical protein
VQQHRHHGRSLVKDTAMRKLLGFIGLALLLGSVPALADWTGKNAAGTTITFKNPGDCTSVVCTPLAALADSTGVNLVVVETAGADAVSNTRNGILGYSRSFVFNGATWDRWTGAVTNAGTFAVQLTGATNNINNIAGTVSLPTGASTSANQTSELTKLDTLHTDLTTLNATAASALAAGTNLIGKVGIDQTTPGTTNGVQVNAALPAGTNTIGNFGFDPSSGKGTPASTFLALPATTTTQIVALSGSTKTYVTSYRVLAGGTVNVTFKTGTGSNCGTGTATLEGPWPLTAQAGMTVGSGTGPVLIAGAGLALCITTDASVTGGVALSYQQF